MLIKQGSAQSFSLLLPYGVAPYVTLGASYQISVNGGALAPGSGSGGSTVSSFTGTQLVTVNLSAADTGTVGDLFVAILDTGGQVIGGVNHQVVAFDPTDANALGLAALSAVNVGSIANGAITDAAFAVPSPPSGLATGMLSMMFQLWRRFFHQTIYDLTSQTIKTYADDNTTVLTTQNVTNNATTQEVGTAS